jgi:tetrahydromethanopterin S-methyltransferase subunit B
MINKLEMPLEQFSEAVAKENARLNNRIEKLEVLVKELLRSSWDKSWPTRSSWDKSWPTMRYDTFEEYMDNVLNGSK